MLKRIATEIQLTNYDVEQIKSIYEFINYLDYVRDELSSFVSIHEEGRFVLSPKLRACAMAAESIRNHAFGIDHSPFPSEEAEEKSVSREHTFDEDESDRETVRQTLHDLADDVGRRLRAQGKWATVARLKNPEWQFLSDFMRKQRNQHSQTIIQKAI